MEDKLTKKYKAISIRTFGFIMIVIAFIMTLILQYSIHDIQDENVNAQKMTDAYINGQLSLINMKSSSDAMIERIRTFTTTGDINYLNDYIENLDDAKAREKTLNEIIEKLNGTSSYSLIVKAVEDIDKMIEIEMHAICLAINGYEIEKTDNMNILTLPDLSEAEEGLSPKQQIEKANNLLFNQEYQKVRNDFTRNIENCISSLSEYTSISRINSYEKISIYQNQQRLAVTVSLILVVIDVAIFWIFIVLPLSRNITHIENGEYLEVKGLKDIQILADAYNRMYERIEKDKEKLSYEASHDSLTGLYNRNAYNIFLSKLDNTDFCYILLDIDDFKGFNDNYGHDVGDLVLKKVSTVLKNNVRNEDLIFRLGGDEFCIVLKGVKKDNKDIVINKTEKIRADLLRKDDNLPEIRISVGATFSSGILHIEKIYKEADVALYRAKKEKNRLEFYEDVI